MSLISDHGPTLRERGCRQRCQAAESSSRVSSVRRAFGPDPTVVGRTITLPCTDLFRFTGQGLIKEMKIFMDATPLFAGPAAAH